MAVVSEFEIGNSYPTTNVELLTVPLPAPRATLPLATKPIELASGGVRGAGWVSCSWIWDVLTQAQYNQLRTFCANKSSDVYLRTRKDDGTYQYYTAKMVWPENPNRRHNHLLGLTFEFRDMEMYVWGWLTDAVSISESVTVAIGYVAGLVTDAVSVGESVTVAVI